MSRTLIFFLSMCLFISSLAVVYVRHQHRLEYTRLTIVNSERDDLFIEWNTLMVAMGTWSSLSRIENAASKTLEMRVPKPNEIVSIERR